MVSSSATTVSAYLASLPPERRRVVAERRDRQRRMIAERRRWLQDPPSHRAPALRCLALCGLALAWAATTYAEPPADDATQAPEPPLEEVLVTGEQPGPGLWKVTRPSDGEGHVLWVLGTHGPLPKRMRWRSAELEARLADSQQLIAPPTMNAKLGPLGGLALLPSLIGVRKNPGGEWLQELIPAELYARWRPLKERYIGRDDDVEKWRPIFAAAELYDSALRASGLDPDASVWPAVKKLARSAEVEVVTPELEVRLEKPREVIKDFKQTPLDDLECFAKTIERLESDLDLMRLRANAWATGDVAGLRELTHVDNASACIEAVMNAQVMQDRGYTDWPERLGAQWVAAAEEALAHNASTVAVLRIGQILDPDGWVGQLRAKGYLVEDP
jgi:uncharacterized protein YbaP (TraB family)